MKSVTFLAFVALMALGSTSFAARAVDGEYLCTNPSAPVQRLAVEIRSDLFHQDILFATDAISFKAPVERGETQLNGAVEFDSMMNGPKIGSMIETLLGASTNVAVVEPSLLEGAATGRVDLTVNPPVSETLDCVRQ